MFNESMFLLQILIISSTAVIGLKIGREALITLVAIQAVLSNLLVSKQIILFGLAATCSDAFSVGSSLCLNLLQEYFGKESVKKAIYISAIVLLFYLAISQVHLFYMPASIDFMQGSFQKIFGLMPRIILASFIAYFISQQLDAKLYSIFKMKFKSFVLKNYASLLISQFADTLLFTILGLYGILGNIGQIILLSFSVKVASILLIAPVTRFIQRIFKII